MYYSSLGHLLCIRNGIGMNKTHHRLHRFINLIISKIESVSICVICGELIHNRKEMNYSSLLLFSQETTFLSE